MVKTIKSTLIKSYLIEIINIHADIEKYRQDGISIENKKILKLEEIDLNCEDVEFEKCVFKDCKIKGSFEKAVFHDGDRHQRLHGPASHRIRDQ